MDNKNQVLVSGACIYKEHGGKVRWFLTKVANEDKWEIPKVIVRKGESSVRASIRMIGEKAAMSARVLEEAGRAGGVVTHNNKTISQRYIYYLMLTKATSIEAPGFPDCIWLEHAKAVRKIYSKREKVMLKQAKKMLELWKKGKGFRRE